MNKIQKINSRIRKILIASSACLLMVSCAEEDQMLEQSANSPAEEIVAVVEESDVASVTISGIYTDVIETVDCASCTFLVPENVTVVDGVALGIRPGSVVCIANGRKLGEVEFINMVGTEEAPIVIGSCEE